jgi:hypothetical protein
MDYHLKQVKVDRGEEWEWIKLLDIMKAEVKETEWENVGWE